MIVIINRPPTTDEVKLFIQHRPSWYKRFEEAVMMFVAVMLVLLAPLLIYNHFYPVSPPRQALFCVGAVVLSVVIVFRIIKKKAENEPDLYTSLNEVEVIHVKTGRAIKRLEYEDFGSSFYIDVTEYGQRKTLYLWGQYLDEMESELLFPNSEFEIIRKKGSDEFISFKTLGAHFDPERILPAFANSVWENDTFPVNGRLLEITLEEIN